MKDAILHHTMNMKHFPKIWLLGASFDTSNMGINALGESSIKCICAQKNDP